MSVPPNLMCNVIQCWIIVVFVNHWADIKMMRAIEQHSNINGPFGDGVFQKYAANGRKLVENRGCLGWQYEFLSQQTICEFVNFVNMVSTKRSTTRFSQLVLSNAGVMRAGFFCARIPAGWCWLSVISYAMFFQQGYGDYWAIHPDHWITGTWLQRQGIRSMAK